LAGTKTERRKTGDLAILAGSHAISCIMVAVISGLSLPYFAVVPIGPTCRPLWMLRICLIYAAASDNLGHGFWLNRGLMLLQWGLLVALLLRGRRGVLLAVLTALLASTVEVFLEYQVARVFAACANPLTSEPPPWPDARSFATFLLILLFPSVLAAPIYGIRWVTRAKAARRDVPPAEPS